MGRQEPDAGDSCCAWGCLIWLLMLLATVIVEGAKLVWSAGALEKCATGVVILLVVGVLAFRAGYNMGKEDRRLFQGPQPGSSHYKARQFKDGIGTTFRYLRRRGWLTKEDARRYARSVDSAVRRIRALESDITTLCSLPDGKSSAAPLHAVVDAILSRLERIHRALARLLAQSALERTPVVEYTLGQAADELEGLLAALEEVTSPATCFVPVESPRPRADAETQIIQ